MAWGRRPHAITSVIDDKYNTSKRDQFCWGGGQRKRQSPTPKSNVRRIHRWLVDSQRASQRASYAENVPFDDVLFCSVIKQKWRTCLMGEVRSLGQGLQLVMPEWQPRVADHRASGMSTSLGPPFTLHYNDMKESHLDIDFIIRTPHPTIKGKAMGWLSWVPCIAKVMDANNLKSPLLQAMAWGRRHRWRIQL